MVNCTRINSAQSIFFGLLPVVKQYHPLPSDVMCKGMVSLFSGDIDFYQMSLSQSESTILHDSIIYSNDDQARIHQNCKFHDPGVGLVMLGCGLIVDIP